MVDDLFRVIADATTSFNDNFVVALFDSIDELKNGYEKVRNWIIDLGDSFKSSVSDMGTDLLDGISNTISSVTDTIKSIFIPDTEGMKVQFLSFKDKVASRLPFGSVSDLDGAGAVGSKEPVDINSNISIPGVGTLANVTFLDLEYFKQGIVYFRPVINGLLTWLMGMFYYREFLSFFGQAPMMAHAKANAELHLEKQEKASK